MGKDGGSNPRRYDAGTLSDIPVDLNLGSQLVEECLNAPVMNISGTCGISGFKVFFLLLCPTQMSSGVCPAACRSFSHSSSTKLQKRRVD